MIKNILVALDGSGHSNAAIKYGVWLAKNFGAKLSGFHAVDIVLLEGPFLHDLSGSVGFEPFLNFSSKMRDALEASGKSILASFKDECESGGIKTETTMSFGIVSNEICEKARLADILVLGRRGVNAKFDYGLLGSVVESVIRKSPAPVFITPERFCAPSNPLLCYDGSPNAAKVIHSAAQFAKTLSMPLTVLHASKEPSGDVLKGAEDYLKPYGIKANFVTVKDDPAAGIKRYYAENNHDIIFMGATHHSKVAEMVLGSTTEYVMRSIEGPFFLER
ncbi:MAG: universal stress protein [Thermodesulfobacteriota bacterium]